MSYTVEKITSSKTKLVFTIPAEEFAQATEQAYRKLRGRVNVPGFRKGKAPRILIERMYGGPSVFYEDAINIWLPKQYDDAVEKEGLRPVDQPEVDVDWAAIEPDKDVTVTCEVPVYPEVTLGAYKGLTVEIHRKTVEEADVDARIEQDRAKLARETEVLDRPVAEGDKVNLDYAGTVDGVAFDGGTAQGQTLEIGSHQFIPGFEEQMVGMCVAEERDLHVTFPENYHAEALAGKEAVFHVKVNAITTTELPELDDEFAADVSDFTTFADYRQSVRETLQKEADEQNRTAAENAVVEQAAANAEMDIPHAMIRRESYSVLRDMEIRMAYQGLRLKDYLSWTGQTVEQLAAQYEDEAAHRLRIQLVLEAIQQAEKVEATEEEIEAETAKQAERMGKDLAEFKQGLTEEQREALKNAAQVTKTVALMMEGVTVNDAPETPAGDEAAEAAEPGEAQEAGTDGETAGE